MRALDGEHDRERGARWADFRCLRLTLNEAGEFACTAAPLGPARDSGPTRFRRSAFTAILCPATRPTGASLYGANSPLGLRRSRFPQPARRSGGRQPQQHLRGARRNATHAAAFRRRARRRAAPALIDEGRCREAMLMPEDLRGRGLSREFPARTDPGGKKQRITKKCWRSPVL